MKKIIFGMLLIAILITIIFLTLQDADGTVRMSECLRHWFELCGIEMTFHSIRSNAHLVLYFLFGISLCLFGRECGWNWWTILAIGCAIGLMDEGIKLILPTREFDLIDLIKDWIGVTIAMLLICFAAKCTSKT